MLNNRQAGRRRGRGGQRQQNGGRDNGNRIDNRARGNAPQLLEKYKTLARDSQLAGDRVMTEYYLQFADHYFRVVAESRARFEESRPQRDEWNDDGDDQVTSEAGENDIDDGDEDRRPQRRQDNRERNDRNDRNERSGRPDRGNNDRDRGDRFGNDRGNRYNGNRGNVQEDEAEETLVPATIDVSVLPPSFASDGVIAPLPDFEIEAEEPAPAPRRRGRPRKAAAEDEASVES